MIAISTSEPVRFTPPWMAEAATPHVFLLRAGSVIEREMLEAELAGEHRAERVLSFELNEAFETGVRALCGDDDAAALIELLHGEAAAADEGQPVAPGDAQTLAEARRALAEHWPDYRALVAQIARRNALLPVIAFQRFCVGWEGPDVPFALGPDRRVSEATLADVHPFALRSAGIAAYNLLYSRGAEKNSAAPSSSSSPPATSPVAEGLPEGGRSTARRGKKTPG